MFEKITKINNRINVIIVALILSVTCISCFRQSDGELIVHNSSMENVEGDLYVCKQKFELQLKPNEIKVIKFGMCIEGDYQFDLKFSSGEKLKENVGYIDSTAYQTKHKAIISKTKIQWEIVK